MQVEIFYIWDNDADEDEDKIKKDINRFMVGKKIMHVAQSRRNMGTVISIFYEKNTKRKGAK